MKYLLIILMLFICSCSSLKTEEDCESCLEENTEENQEDESQEDEKDNEDEKDETIDVNLKIPIKYFTFASDSSIVLNQNLTDISKKFNGNIMLGGDASYPDVSSEFKQVMKKADSLKAKKHVYLEGPGGVTGSSGIAPDECDRMKKRAKAVGIDVIGSCSYSNAWVKKWNSTGWWESVKKEIAYFHKNYGATSVEIDNLYVAGIESSSSVLKFLKKFQSEKFPVTIMLKNLTVDDLAILRKDIQSKFPDRLLRSTLTDFMISEEDFSGEWSAIATEAKKINIKMLKSHDTYNYQAKGYFDN